MKKLLIAGDWHGSKYAAASSMADAERDNCDAVFQVGDFGVTFGDSDWFLNQVSGMATTYRIPVYFIDGNHENFDRINGWLRDLPRNDNGHIQVKPYLYYVPRGSVWEWEGKTFAAMGGAASIDRGVRTEGIDYFKDELITAKQTYDLLDAVDNHGKRVDYFFTHDCSDYTPWGFILIPDKDSLHNRRVLDGIINYVRPANHWHGHMHKRFEWNNSGTMTYGLNMENERHSRGILDVATGQFEFCTYHSRVL